MNDSTTTSTYQGRHRDVSETARWINVLKELSAESVALHDTYEPRHSAAHRPAAVVSHLTLALTAEGAR